MSVYNKKNSCFHIKIKGKTTLEEMVLRGLRQPSKDGSVTDKNLVYYDYFVSECGTEKKFYEHIKKVAIDYGILKESDEIEKVTIHSADDAQYIERNLVFGNPYINEAVRANDSKTKYLHLKRKDILGEKDVITIDRESELYKGMCNYLFNVYVPRKALDNEPEERKDTTLPFYKELHKYIEFYGLKERGAADGEDINEFYMIEDSLKEMLMTYTMFRLVAIERYEYEKKFIDEDVVDYEQVRGYLFDSLTKNSKEFFGKIFTSKSNFAKLLKEYAKLYADIQKKEAKKEDLKKLEELKNEIEDALHVRKNYDLLVAKISQASEPSSSKTDPVDGLTDASDYFELLRQEENIETPEEYEQMYSDGSVPPRPIRK